MALKPRVQIAFKRAQNGIQNSYQACRRELPALEAQQGQRKGLTLKSLREEEEREREEKARESRAAAVVERWLQRGLCSACQDGPQSLPRRFSHHHLDPFPVVHRSSLSSLLAQDLIHTQHHEIGSNSSRSTTSLLQSWRKSTT